LKIFLEELKVDPSENELAQYKLNWLNYVCKMEDTKYSKRVLVLSFIGLTL